MSLKDKASKIDFASLVSQHAAPADAKQPKTAPGAMMAFANDARSDLLKENEQLRERAAKAADLEARLGEAVADLQAWDGAKPTRLLRPEQIARSRFANRHPSSFVGADFDQLKREITEAGGNVQPIKVRPIAKNAKGLKGDGEGEAADFEIVFGHRRHEACRQLGLPVLAVVDNLDDRTLFVEMDRENRERADLSPWEQGVMYAKALDQGLFGSNRQLASALGIDHSNLGKSLALARLPDEVVAAFGTPLEIQLRWAPLLNKVLETDPQGVRQRAVALSGGAAGRSAKSVLASLLGMPPEPKEEGGDRVFEVGGKKAATLSFDLFGRATLRVHKPLTAEQQQQLARSIDVFVAAL